MCLDVYLLEYHNSRGSCTYRSRTRLARHMHVFRLRCRHTWMYFVELEDISVLYIVPKLLVPTNMNKNN